jgi:tRNA pseudouridine55 synthase
VFGLLNVNKPAGVTSRDVVNSVQRLVRPHKVGHAGTLDPLATGVLVVAIGPATRLIEYIQRMLKTYRATFLLGQTSDTEDIEGNVRELPDPPRPTAEQIQAAIPSFVGTIEQVPPAFSALKVAGQRAYDLARQGRTVELAARPVEIHELTLVSYAYPELTLLIRCGSGTYVRSLGRDLARSLGTDAVMSALVRESIGPFALAGAVDGNRLSGATIAAHLQSPLLAVSELPRLDVTVPEAQRLALGQSILNRWESEAPERAAIDAERNLVAVVVPAGDGKLRAAKSFQSLHQDR